MDDDDSNPYRTIVGAGDLHWIARRVVVSTERSRATLRDVDRARREFEAVFLFAAFLELALDLILVLARDVAAILAAELAVAVHR